MRMVLQGMSERACNRVDVTPEVQAVGLGQSVSVHADVWRLIVSEPVPPEDAQIQLLPAQRARLLDLACSARQAINGPEGGLFEHWVLRPGADAAALYRFAIIKCDAPRKGAWLICQSSL